MPACETPNMRAPLALLLALLALTVAACGGGDDAAAPADAAAVASAEPTPVVEGEPDLADYAGKPLAIVFFHPL